jgi:hypothetical protein
MQWFGEPLDNWADGLCATKALGDFVGDIARV